jgi:hypothetical protein
VADRLRALLDHPFLSRVGNLRTLATIAIAVGLVVIGLVLAAIQLLTRAGWVPLLFVGVGLLLFVLLGMSRVWAVRQRRPRALDPAVVAVVERLRAVADQIEALYDARRVEEPRESEDLAVRIADPGGHARALADYRKKTMALYYERHRNEALSAWDDCYPLGYTQGRERERGIIQEPAGTAALRLVPGVLRDMGWKLTGA